MDHEPTRPRPETRFPWAYLPLVLLPYVLVGVFVYVQRNVDPREAMGPAMFLALLIPLSAFGSILAGVFLLIRRANVERYPAIKWLVWLNLPALALLMLGAAELPPPPPAGLKLRFDAFELTAADVARLELDTLGPGPFEPGSLVQLSDIEAFFFLEALNRTRAPNKDVISRPKDLLVNGVPVEVRCDHTPAADGRPLVFRLTPMQDDPAGPVTLRFEFDPRDRSPARVEWWIPQQNAAILGLTRGPRGVVRVVQVTHRCPD